MKCEVWSVKTLLRLSLKKNRLSREGHARDRLALNYRSFILGKLPPPACPGLCYFSKTTNHILGITPFGVRSSPLEKHCNLKNVHL